MNAQSNIGSEQRKTFQTGSNSQKTKEQIEKNAKSSDNLKKIKQFYNFKLQKKNQKLIYNQKICDSGLGIRVRGRQEGHIMSLGNFMTGSKMTEGYNGHTTRKNAYFAVRERNSTDRQKIVDISTNSVEAYRKIPLTPNAELGGRPFDTRQKSTKVRINKNQHMSWNIQKKYGGF